MSSAFAILCMIGLIMLFFYSIKITELSIRNSELQKRIDKAIEYITNLKIWYEHNDNICSTEDKFKKDLLEILKGNENE